VAAVAHHDPLGAGVTWAGGWAASLAQGRASLKVLLGPLGAPIVSIGDDELEAPVVVSGGGLRLRDWQTSAPQLRVALRGTPLRLAAVRGVAPGATVQLQLETVAGSERVFAGRLRESVTTEPGRLELVVDGAETWAQSRYAATGWRPGLWDGFTGTSTITATYTPGDTTLHTAIPSTPFCAGPGGPWVLIHVDIGAGYYLAANTHAVGLLSGVTMLQWVGEEPTAAPPGTVISYGPLVAGSPLDVLLRVLISSGAGTGGAYDVLPDGLAIPAGLIDTVDAAALASCIGALGVVDRYTFGSTEPQREPEGGDLLAWAAYLGLWLCQRQGALTVRAAVDPHDAAAWAALYVGDVTDALLLQVGAHTTRAPDCLPEYQAPLLWRATPALLVPDGEVDYGVVNDPLRASLAPTTQPVGSSLAQLSYPVEIASIAWLIPVAEQDEHVDDLRRRVAPWWGRQCEAVEVVLGGEAMGWACGDLVSVTSIAIPGPAADGGVAVGRRALWVPQAWDWTARQVAGTLYLLASG
jgi:hypothetical protein